MKMTHYVKLIVTKKKEERGGVKNISKQKLISDYFVMCKGKKFSFKLH